MQVSFGDDFAAFRIKAGASPQVTFISLILAMLVGLAPLGQWLGGMFNPCDAAVLYAKGSLPAVQAILRTLSQTAGALTGAYGAAALLPVKWSSRGESLIAATGPGVGTLGAASCEFLLTYFLTLMTITAQRSQSIAIRSILPLGLVAGALIIGSPYSGPVLNPAAALSWTAMHWNKYTFGVAQHVAVFWVAPILAAVLAQFTAAGMQAHIAPNAKLKQA